jgi:anti-sigma factor RsiW
MKTSDVDLAEYALGTLPRDAGARIEAMMADSPALRHEVDQVVAALALVAERLTVEPPPPGGRQRLLESINGAKPDDPEDVDR